MSFRNDDDFDSESYVKVNVRLMEFWQQNPKGRVETEAVLSDNRLMMVARLYREGEEKAYATGHSFLDNLDGEKVGEYTETVALGRALANAGFKIEKSIASAQEMTRFKERQESKSETKVETKAPPRSTPPRSAPKAETKTEVKETASANVKPPVHSGPTDGGTSQEIKDQPTEVKKLTTSRIFKPLPKPEQQTTGAK